MRKLLSTTAAIAALAMGMFVATPPPARAQMTVIDPAAIAQMTSQVANSLRQIEQLQSQITNQVAMLQKLGTDVTQPLTQINQQATQLLQQAQAIGYNSQNIAQQFQQLYPSDMTGQSFAQIRQRLASWESNSRLTMQDSMAAQNQLVRLQATTAGASSFTMSTNGRPAPMGGSCRGSPTSTKRSTLVHASNSAASWFSVSIDDSSTITVLKSPQRGAVGRGK